MVKIKHLGLTLIVAMLAACDAKQSQPNQLQYLSTGDTGAAMVATLPDRIRTIKQVDSANVGAIATVNGVQVQLQKNDANQFVGQIEVPGQSSVVVSTVFYENFAGQQLTLATVERTLNTQTSDVTLNLRQSDYNFSHDADNDGFSNLVERESNTNPLNPEQNPNVVQIEVVGLLSDYVAALGYTNYQFELSIGSFTESSTTGVSEFRKTVSVPGQQPLDVGVVMVEVETGERVVLAAQSVVVQQPENQPIVVFSAGNYNYGYDDDNDTIINLQEMSAGTNPLQADVCTPEPEIASIELTEDAYLDINALLINDDSLRVEFDTRRTLIRFQYDQLPGEIINAELALTVGIDPGEGLISVYALPDFDWDETGLVAFLPGYEEPVAQIDDEWEFDQRYTFNIDPAAVVQDLTLLLVQESDEDDVAFHSSEDPAGPELRVTYEVCE